MIVAKMEKGLKIHLHSQESGRIVQLQLKQILTGV